MASYLWLIPPEGALALTHELPRSLIVPHVQASNLGYRINGETIWIVDNNEGYLLAKVVASQTSKFIQGINKGDSLIHIDFSQSVRIGARKIFVKESLHAFNIGITELNENQHISWSRLVLNLVETKFLAPKVESLKIPFEQHIRDVRIGLEDSTMAFLIQRLSVDQVWRKESEIHHGPYASFAKALLQACGISNLEYQEHYLNQIDPICSLEIIPDANLNAKIPTKVDLFFTEIDPTKVTYRQFTDTGSIRDKKMAISMLNDAERRHQQVLKLISEFIVSIELIPQQSNSVDLLVNKGKVTLLCEIKTIHETNFESQIAKGIYQVIKYELAMNGRFGEVSSVLIIEGNANRVELIRAERVAERLGVEVVWVGDINADGLNTQQFHSLIRNRLSS